ncbi:hypothetical protein ACJX0J_023078, partial [Zea mays]
SSGLYSPSIINATEARQNRRRYLNQKRMAKKGIPNQTTESLHCGHFTKEYIQALKGLKSWMHHKKPMQTRKFLLTRTKRSNLIFGLLQK